MKKKFNKKGGDTESDTQLFWTFFLVPAMIIFVLILIYVISVFLSSRVAILEGVKDSSYEARILGSPNCFAYEDEISGRVYNGYIDVAKFNNDAINDCFNNTNQDKRGIILLLKFDNDEKEIKTNNALVKISSSLKTTKMHAVHVVKEDGTITQGLLTIIYWI